MSSSSTLLKIFHRDLSDADELLKCANEFVVWKKTIDKTFCDGEYTSTDAKDAKFLSRCSGRERARLFDRASSTDSKRKFAIEYRLRNSVFSRFLQLLKCVSANDDLKRYVFSALEMFRIAFVDNVQDDRRQELPPCKRWMIDYIVNEVKCLVTNTFDQSLHGRMPVFHSVDRVRALFTRAVESPTNVSILHVPNVGMSCDELTRRRVSLHRRRLRKSRKIPILTRRLSPSRMMPPTNPMPETSDGVGSMT